MCIKFPNCLDEISKSLLIPLVKRYHVPLKNNKKILPNTQIMSLECVIVRFTMFKDYPFIRVLYIIFKTPDIFTYFIRVLFLDVLE